MPRLPRLLCLLRLPRLATLGDGSFARGRRSATHTSTARSRHGNISSDSHSQPPAAINRAQRSRTARVRAGAGTSVQEWAVFPSERHKDGRVERSELDGVVLQQPRLYSFEAQAWVDV